MTDVNVENLLLLSIGPHFSVTPFSSGQFRKLEVLRAVVCSIFPLFL